jgi:hypothetical protein
MTCTRSLSLTQTKTIAKLKTLESLLQTRNEDTGEVNLCDKVTAGSIVL